MQLQYIQCSPFSLPIIGCTDNTEYIYMYVYKTLTGLIAGCVSRMWKIMSNQNL